MTFRERCEDFGTEHAQEGGQCEELTRISYVGMLSDGERETLRAGSAALAREVAAREQAERERDEARKTADEEEREHTKTMEERDHREKQIEQIAMALGCEDEWTSVHDHGDCALELAEILEARASASERARDTYLGLYRTLREHLAIIARGERLEEVPSTIECADVLARIATAEQSAERMANALDDLVSLKDRKDRVGKDAVYERRQPLAWEGARAALSAFEAGRAKGGRS